MYYTDTHDLLFYLQQKWYAWRMDFDTHPSTNGAVLKIFLDIMKQRWLFFCPTKVHEIVNLQPGIQNVICTLSEIYYEKFWCISLKRWRCSLAWDCSGGNMFFYVQLAKKKRTSLWIWIQITLENWNLHQSTWVIVYFNLML